MQRQGFNALRPSRSRDMTTAAFAGVSPVEFQCPEAIAIPGLPVEYMPGSKRLASSSPADEALVRSWTAPRRRFRVISMPNSLIPLVSAGDLISPVRAAVSNPRLFNGLHGDPSGASER